IDSTDFKGRMPLSYNTELGNFSLLKLFLDRGAAVDSTDSSGSTPLLHAALLLDREPLGELFLGRGGKVDLADSKGRTPLSYSAE
ncbi:hypothetical protein EV426DRAFT_510240, partial [Tirmania nivea]